MPGKRYTPRRVSVRKTQKCLDLLEAAKKDINILGDLVLDAEVTFAIDTFTRELAGPKCPDLENQMMVGAIGFYRAIAATIGAGEALDDQSFVDAAEALGVSLSRGISDCA